MGNAISSAITDSWLASHKRRVKKWLDNATEDSVHDALTSSFFPRGKESSRLPAARDAGPYIKAAFGSYGYIDEIDQKRYWRETDLGLFLSNRFPGPELNASIPILWRCFHFHAYFPFPQKPERLDYSAFQRAIGLLAAEGNLRLGDNADGVTMDADKYPDTNARALKRLSILFKSLSIESRLNQLKSIGSSVADWSSTEEHLMDVLCLTQPDDPCIMPAPIEELRPHAERILSSSTPYTCSLIPRRDFLRLLKLLLSVQLIEPEWGSHEPYFHTGHVLIHPGSDTLQGAADALLRRFTSSEKSDVNWHSFKNVLSVYVPDFTSQFRLIFTSFLSPVTATSQALNKSTPNNLIPVPYAQYLNLFLHPPLAHPRRHVFEEFARQEAHYALQTTHSTYSASPPTLNTTDLVAALNPIKTGTLLLITGEAIARKINPPTRITIGACMPTPWDIQRQRSFRANPPQKLHRYTPDHKLFQLEPCQEILQPEADAWIMDLIHVAESDSGSGTRGGLRFGAENGSGLFVDFDSGLAVLRNVTTNKGEANQDKQSEKPSTPNSSYHSVSPSNNEEKPANNWESRMRVQKFEIYDLGGHATAPFEEQLAEKPRLRTASPKPYRMQAIKGGAAPVQKVSEPRVGEEELRKRIKGFGSSGR
ncbi:MAG: hypothetical protein ASARMPREDX12_004235 [Alectoria sarmentosa]|nr:MAG: hypothetical protein ASARMPREDX12_004235 [Alectoria sarmentosa]